MDGWGILKIFNNEAEEMECTFQHLITEDIENIRTHIKYYFDEDMYW